MEQRRRHPTGPMEPLGMSTGDDRKATMMLRKQGELDFVDHDALMDVDNISETSTQERVARERYEKIKEDAASRENGSFKKPAVDRRGQYAASRF